MTQQIKKLIINHKDGNKTNNNVENLEIYTYSENVKHAHETGLIGNRNEKEEELNLENEIWLDIKDYDKYKISNFGRLKSFNNGKEKILKNSIVNSYCQVTLSKNGKTKSCCVHKLVYSTFNNDYDLDGYVIDHIDNNPLNNNIDNLQKITNKENIEKELKKGQTYSTVLAYKDGEFIGEYYSCAEAGRQLKCDPSSISKACRGKYKTVHDYIFKYKE